MAHLNTALHRETGIAERKRLAELRRRMSEGSVQKVSYAGSVYWTAFLRLFCSPERARSVAAGFQICDGLIVNLDITMSKLLSPLFALAPVVQGVGATAFPPDALVPPMEGIVFLDLVGDWLIRMGVGRAQSDDFINGEFGGGLGHAVTYGHISVTINTSLTYWPWKKNLLINQHW